MGKCLSMLMIVSRLIKIVLIAVEENGWALEYVSENLRKDEDILSKVSDDIKNMLNS